MKPIRLTNAHQSITFSRRMLLLGGAQAAIGALLVGRMGWLAVAQNEKYQLLSREQPRPADPGAAAARLDHRPQRQADRDQPVELPRRPHPAADGRCAQDRRAGSQILDLPADEVDRINRELAVSRGFQPVSVADNIAYEQYAAITVRLPELPGVAARAGSTRFYPGGSTVGQLVGYVGAASAAEYEKENKNPLLLIPGVKIGKEGLEQTMESDASRAARRPAGRSHRARQAGQGARSQARPQRRHRPADHRCRPSRICGAADRRPVGGRRRHRRGQRRHPGDAVDALVRSQQFSDGISNNEWKMLSGDDHLPLVDKALESLYPSGSTIKPSMAMALLNAGIDRTQKVNCTGAFQTREPHFPLRQAARSGRYGRGGRPQLRRLFLSMCLRVGADKLSPMVRSMGFGEKFDLPFDNQRYGTIPDPSG